MRVHPGQFGVWVLTAAFALARAHCVLAQTPAAGLPLLTGIEQVRALSPAEASRGYPVRIEAVVTYSDPQHPIVPFVTVQDGFGGIGVLPRNNQIFPRRGQLVVVEGPTKAGLHLAFIDQALLQVVGEGVVPEPRVVTIQELWTAKHDAHYVEVEGEVRSVLTRQGGPELSLVAGGQRIKVAAVKDAVPEELLSRLRDARVRVRGVCVVETDLLRVVRGVFVFFSGTEGLTILREGSPDPFSPGLIPSSKLLDPNIDAGLRVRVAGRVIEKAADGILMLRDGEGTVQVRSLLPSRVRLEDQVEASGFPVRGTSGAVIEDCVVRLLGPQRGGGPTEGAGAARPPGVESYVPVLVEAAQVSRISMEDARSGLPVRLEGAITYVGEPPGLAFVQDDTGGIGVQLPEGGEHLQPGRAVQVEGYTGLHATIPVVVSPKINVLGDAPPLAAERSSLQQLAAGGAINSWVEVQGVVRALTQTDPEVEMAIAQDAARITAHVRRAGAASPGAELVDSEVRIQGVCAAAFNPAGQFIGVRILVPSVDRITVTRPGSPDPFILPVEEIGGLLQFAPGKQAQHRVRVQGDVTLHRPGELLCIRDPSGSLLIESDEQGELRPGTKVDAAGFIAHRTFAPVLEDAVAKSSGLGPPPEAKRLAAPGLLDAALHCELVRASGILLDVQTDASDHTLFLRSGEVSFRAQLAAGKLDSRVASIEAGSEIEVTGVCLLEAGAGGVPKSCRVMLRAAEDVTVLARPPWWTAGRALGVTGLLAGLALAGSAWVALLKKQVSAQTRATRAELARVGAFSELARELASTVTAEDAARAILKVAQNLFGWDASFLHLWSPESKSILPLITIDTMEGERKEVPAGLVGRKLSPFVKRVLEDGPQLVLRTAGDEEAQSLAPMGDTRRRSASLMFVPIYKGSASIGVLSIQSYTPFAYKTADLQTLQALANHGAGALARIQEMADRQRAEEDLRQSQMRFRSVVENLGEGVLITDLSDVVLYANSRMEELCGYTQAELLRHPAYELIVPKSGWAELQRKNHRRGDGISENYEIQLRRKDGTRFWAEVNATPHRNASGEVIGTIGALTDITERKRAEARNAAFASLGHKLSATNRPEEAAQIIAHVAQDLLGWDACTLDLYVPEQDAIQSLVSMDTVNSERIEVSNPLEGRPPSLMMRRVIEEGAQLILRDAASTDPVGLTAFGDVTRKSASLLFVPIRRAARVIGFLSVQSYTSRAYDLQGLATLQALADHCAGTFERLQAVQELRRSEERFSKAFRSSPIPILLCTQAGDRVLDMNDSLVQLLGYPSDDILGRTTTELNLWTQPDQQRELLGKLDLQRSVREFECKLRTKRDESRDVLVSAELFQIGNTPCVLYIFQDITERLNLETQLRQSQKMEAVGQLSAGVAHDFNNILTVIQGHTSLLLGTEPLSSGAKEALEQVATAAERAANLTSGLLAFSRKRLMRPKPVNLGEIVMKVGPILRGLLGETVSLQVDFPPDLPLVRADVGMMEQVIMNLTLNARDAMPDGGNLKIALVARNLDDSHQLQNPEARSGRFVCMSVTDAGSGMDARTLARIFEPFFTTKDIGKGTGLGLSTVYGIVKQHQGWVEVQSELGAGSTFRVYLPASADLAEPRPNVDLPLQARGGTETVLIVEDEPSLRRLVANLLTSFGYSILQAANGAEALELWAEQSGLIDVLLTDLVMPGKMSGFELAQTMRMRKPGLKVIYTSGYSVDLQAQKPSLREGLNYLPKPYPAAKLAATLRNCLDTDH